MKYLKTGVFILLFFITIASNAQETLPSTGAFGEAIKTKGAVSVKKLPKKMAGAESLDLTVKGEITEVCQAKGCWMILDLGNGELMRVKFKDYGFFVPKDAAGKTVIMKGTAKKEIIGVDELKHLAEDAGKTEEEIAAIQTSKEELTFVAEGVVIE